MKIAIGADHGGFTLKTELVIYLTQAGHVLLDMGTFSGAAVDYPDYARAVAKAVRGRDADRGVLICGSGVGACIAANKFPGVRAAPCHDDLTAEMSRRHNDLNVLCLSGDILGERLVDRLVGIWLKTEFEGGRHARRVRKIADLERRNGKP